MSHRDDGRSLDITLRSVILEFSQSKKNTRLRTVTTTTINITLSIFDYKVMNTSNEFESHFLYASNGIIHMFNK